jgi:hypothetical protein
MTHNEENLNKINRYTNIVKRPNLIEKYEEEEELKDKQFRKKQWLDGGNFSKEDNPDGLLSVSEFVGKKIL